MKEQVANLTSLVTELLDKVDALERTILGPTKGQLPDIEDGGGREELEAAKALLNEMATNVKAREPGTLLWKLNEFEMRKDTNCILFSNAHHLYLNPEEWARQLYYYMKGMADASK